MSRQKRPAFTSIELLVVIAIIAILAALIFAGVAAIRGKEMLSTTQIEISEMKAALENFKTRFGAYPPSSVQVGPNQNLCSPESRRILTTIWPSLDFNKAFGAEGWNLPGVVTLKGDQCLVLFLGGLHDARGCQGFSTSKVNPFRKLDPTEPDREQPFFKFKTARLYQRDASSPFYSYGDGFFKMTLNGAEQFPCYAYFAPRSGKYQDADCSNVLDAKGDYPQPYKDADGAYINKQSYQIVSSGKDMLWGKAQKWASGAGVIDAAGNGNSLDNISNFASGLLSGS